MNHPERDEQAAVIAWARMSEGRWPCLARLHSSLNGAFLHGDVGQRARQWKALESQGAVKGVPDLCLPFPVAPYHGAYCEMKEPGGGRKSAEQVDWISYLRSVGYAAEFCAGAEQAIEFFTAYLTGSYK